MDNRQEAINFCKNVTLLRKQHGLTQVQMAAILDVGVGTVRSLERGILPPRLTIAVLLRVYDHFHVLPSRMLLPPQL